jgi:integrase/recombinase XerD
MARLSNKSIAEILSSSKEFISFDDKEKELDRKITLATEGFTTNKYCELVLRDRNRLSKENALTLCNYIIDYKREINPKLNTIRTAIQHVSELSKAVGVGIQEKKFADMTREDILLFLDHYRKLENDDPMHKWINTYNSNRSVVLRFFKWLYFPEIGDPKKMDKLCAETKEPKCIQDIAKLKKKEISSYKPSDMWTPEDDLLFLKYVTNKRDRCYHTMARDSSARPHELLNLKIKDVMFKLAADGKSQYAGVLLNGKTGPRPTPLIQSIPYIKDWLSDHPSRNNPNAPLFVSVNNHSKGRKRLASNSLYRIYDYYKKVFFPKLLLQDPTIPSEDKEKIKALLAKPWNPYVRRHTGLTQCSRMLKEAGLRQYAGWSPKSNMPQIYIHYFGNESSESLLEAYGIVTKNSGPSSVELLSPKLCPNCNEGNTADAKFCAKCRMVLTYDGYNETLQQQKEKELEIQKLQQKYEQLAAQTDQIKELQKHIVEINEAIGRPNPRDLTGDIEFYKRMKNDELAVKTGRELEQSAKEIRENPELKAYMKEHGYDFE